jgi:hypothetical protein
MRESIEKIITAISEDRPETLLERLSRAGCSIDPDVKYVVPRYVWVSKDLLQVCNHAFVSHHVIINDLRRLGLA